jgi:hypothetical protein
MAQEQTAREIQRLLRLEKMMTEAYDIAMNKMNDQKLIEVLAPFRAHHQESAHALQQVSQGGGEPQLEDGFRRYLEEVLGTIDDAVRRDEALGELRLAEATLNMAYSQALEVKGDGETTAVLKQCMRNEAEHLGVLAMAHDTSKT